MNVKESKTNILLEAVYKILSEDSANTGYTMREMNFYVGDNINRPRLEMGAEFPQVTFEVDEYETDLLIPTQKYQLTVSGHVKKDMAYAQTTLDNLTARIEYLLNKKPSSLNLAVPSKKLRCRLINKISGLKTTDELKEVHTKNLIFEVVLDDEIIQCNN